MVKKFYHKNDETLEEPSDFAVNLQSKPASE